MATKNNIFREHLERYLSGTKAQQGAILDHVCFVTGMHRKAATRRFGKIAAARTNARPTRRGPKVRYGPLVTSALVEVWELFYEVCAERLHPQLPEYVRVLQSLNDWHYDHATTDLLLAMSLGTMKDRLETVRQKRGLVGRGRGMTKPGLLKELIPIRRGPWENPSPGYAEVDTVAHCGSTLLGDFIYTVQTTDVATLWALLQAQWNKGQHATVSSLAMMRNRSPFPWLGLDPDSGSEFINWHCKDWADEQYIELSRTRPYRKNDHARIEQKNYANVRDFVGYYRYDTKEQVALLNELYRAMEDYLNFFVGSQKCVRKERIGSHYRRIYDTARPSYQRVLADGHIDQSVKEQLLAKYATLNPRTLKTTIDRLTKRLRQSVQRTP